MEASCDDTCEDFRVNVTAKKTVVGQIAKYQQVLKRVLEDQPGINDDNRQVLLNELLANFEASVQKNVLVNGQPWDEAPEDEEDAVIALEGLLDDTIVETTRKRHRYPRQILPHLVRSLKAERKLMGLYEQAVKPQEAVKDPCQVSIMNNVSAAAPGMVKEAIQVMKSINTLQKQAEGLCQVLNMRPNQGSVEIYKEVFGCDTQLNAPLPPSNVDNRNKESIKTVVEEAATRDCYVPSNNKKDNPVVVPEH